MDYGDNIERARAFARQALDFMQKHQIPPTPANFSVWYAYSGDKVPDLGRALDVLITNNQPFTPAQNAEIYDTFFTHTDEGVALQQASKRVEEQMNKVSALLEGASDEVEDYGESLKTGMGRLADSQEAGSPDREGVGPILTAVQDLLRETQAMQESNRQLQEKLRTSSVEIASLRQNLESAQKEALTDALTGIANRKMFDAALRQAAMEAMESGEPLSLALVDIDHFKAFNDTYGHQTGDQVLRIVAQILDANVKGRDLAARFGGEEFAVVLPQTELRDARVVCEQIRGAVATKRFRNKQTGEDLGNLTLSLGVARFELGEPLPQLVQRADEALYFAKRGGRNRTVGDDEIATIEAR